METRANDINISNKLSGKTHIGKKAAEAIAKYMLADDTESLHCRQYEAPLIWFVTIFCICNSCRVYFYLTEQSEGSPSVPAMDDAITSIANSDDTIKSPHMRWVFVQMIQEHVVPSNTLSSDSVYKKKKK